MEPSENLGKNPEYTVKYKYQGVSDWFEFHFKYWYVFLMKAYQSDDTVENSLPVLTSTDLI